MRQTIRILHILDHSIPMADGYSYRTRSILEQQRKLGWETAHVTSLKHTAGSGSEETVDGYHFYRTIPGSSWMEAFPVLNQLAVITTLERRLRDLVPRLRPDILHAHSPCLTGVAALMAGKRFDLPVVYEVRALWEEGPVMFGRTRAGSLKYRASRAIENYVTQRVDAVTTICEGLKNEFVERGIPPKKITVIPNAVDAERFPFDRPRDPALAGQLGIEGKTVIGFAGSLKEYEGLGLLLQAVPSLVKQEPGVRVLVLGGGERESALRQQARDDGIEDFVVFTGWVPHVDMHRYYSLMEVMVYPRIANRSMELTTPLKPLEAMAQGKVVVASDIGGHRELIRHGKTGILFSPGDKSALVDAVVGVLRNPQQRAALRDAGRRFVESERTWAQSVSRYQAIYESLLKDGRKARQA